MGKRLSFPFTDKKMGSEKGKRLVQGHIAELSGQLSLRALVSQLLSASYPAEADLQAISELWSHFGYTTLSLATWTKETSSKFGSENFRAYDGF